MFQFIRIFVLFLVWCGSAWGEIPFERLVEHITVRGDSGIINVDIKGKGRYGFSADSTEWDIKTLNKNGNRTYIFTPRGKNNKKRIFKVDKSDFLISAANMDDDDLVYEDASGAMRCTTDNSKFKRPGCSIITKDMCPTLNNSLDAQDIEAFEADKCTNLLGSVYGAISMSSKQLPKSFQKLLAEYKQLGGSKYLVGINIGKMQVYNSEQNSQSFHGVMSSIMKAVRYCRDYEAMAKHELEFEKEELKKRGKKTRSL